MSEPTPTIAAYFPDDMLNQLLDERRADLREALRDVLTGVDFSLVPVAEGDTPQGRLKVVAIFVNEPVAIVLTAVVRGMAEQAAMLKDRAEAMAKAKLEAAPQPTSRLQ